MSTQATAVVPANWDPDAPEAARHEFAKAMLDEAKGLWNGSVERFVVLMATIRSNHLYKLLGFATFDGLVRAEFGVSPATGKRWVAQGNELLAAAPEPKAIGPATNGLGVSRPNEPARISQRQAAKAQAERREPKAEPQKDEAPPPAPEAEAPKPTPAPKPARAHQPAPEEPPAPADKWEDPEPPAPVQATARVVLRESLTTLLAFLAAVDAAEMASVATEAERRAVCAFAAPFAPKPAKAAGECKHPRNRRLGTFCAVCGADVKP